VKETRTDASTVQTAKFFADRPSRADFKAFYKIMLRRGGSTPRQGDEMPRRKRGSSLVD
jgi:hypothetical protein